jgi:hypothetical protein
MDTKPLLEFLDSKLPHHVIYYNHKWVSMEMFPKKEQFKIGCRRIADNAPIGWIKTPHGTYFEVSQTRRLALKTSSQEILQKIVKKELYGGGDETLA